MTISEAISRLAFISMELDNIAANWPEGEDTEGVDMAIDVLEAARSDLRDRLKETRI